MLAGKLCKCGCEKNFHSYLAKFFSTDAAGHGIQLIATRRNRTAERCEQLSAYAKYIDAYELTL